MRPSSPLHHLLAACACAAGLCAPAFGQDGGKVDYDDLSTARRLFQERQREDIHPGEPLNLVGIEEGSTDFLADTPVFQHSDRRVAQVDVEEERRRRLAMYEQGMRFDAPARPLVSTPRAEDGEPAASTRGKGRTDGPQDDADETDILIAVVGILAVGVWLMRPKA